MLPLPVVPFDASALPENAQRLLRHLTWAIICLWFFGLIMLFLEPGQALTPLCGASIGTFLQHNDPRLIKCYRLLRPSCQCFGTGLQMLLPFFVVAFLGFLIDGINLIRLFQYYGLANTLLDLGLVSMIAWALLGLWIANFAGMVLSGLVLRAVIDTQDNSVGTFFPLPGQGTTPQTARMNLQVLHLTAENSHNGANTSENNNRFQPFSGTPHRI